MTEKKLLVRLNGVPMGTLFVSRSGIYDSMYDFSYADSYRVSGKPMFPELLSLSETMYALFSNTLPEGVRLKRFSKRLRTDSPFELFSGTFDGQNGFSFESPDNPFSVEHRFSPVPVSIKRKFTDSPTIDAPWGKPRRIPGLSLYRDS